MIDFSAITEGGDLSGKLNMLKMMIPSLAEIMQTYKQEGETEIIAIGTFEKDSETNEIKVMVRLASYKTEISETPEGKEVKKMVINRFVKKDGEFMQWNLLDFLNLIPNGQTT